MLVPATSTNYMVRYDRQYVWDVVLYTPMDGAKGVMQRVISGENPPLCRDCGEVLKPNAVFFGELLPQVPLAKVPGVSPSGRSISGYWFLSSGFSGKYAS